MESDEQSSVSAFAHKTGSYGSSECPCIGISGMPGDLEVTIGKRSVAYPADVGSSCAAWDNGKYPSGCTNSSDEPGKGKDWCAAKWCYVDPCNCGYDTRKAMYMDHSQFQGKSLYYSYATCGNTDTFPEVMFTTS